MPDFTYDQVANEIRTIDKKRKKYCTFYTKSEFGMADYYDICLDSSRLGIDECISIIKEVAEREN